MVIHAHFHQTKDIGIRPTWMPASGVVEHLEEEIVPFLLSILTRGVTAKDALGVVPRPKEWDAPFHLQVGTNTNPSLILL